MDLVFTHVMSPQIVLAGEATWVLTNAIAGASDEDLLTFLRIYGAPLVNALLHWINVNARDKGEKRLTLEVLSSVDKLLHCELASAADDFTSILGVKDAIDEADGFSSIEDLANVKS